MMMMMMMMSNGDDHNDDDDDQFVIRNPSKRGSKLRKFLRFAQILCPISQIFIPLQHPERPKFPKARTRFARARSRGSKVWLTPNLFHPPLPGSHRRASRANFIRSECLQR